MRIVARLCVRIQRLGYDPISDLGLGAGDRAPSVSPEYSHLA